MLFKLVNTYFSLVFFLLLPSWALATMTVTPLRSDRVTKMFNYYSNVAYYPVNTLSDTVGSYFLDTADTANPMPDRYYNLSASQTSGDDGSHALWFEITSDDAITVAAGEELALVVNTTAGGTLQAVPIAYYAGEFCSTGGSSCGSAAGNFVKKAVTNAGYYWAGLYTPKQTVVVGIYPKDICGELGGSQAITGCSAGIVDAVNTRIALSFAVRALNSTAPPRMSSSSDWKSSSALSLSFATLLMNPTSSCPDFSTVYFPSDTAIELDASSYARNTVTGSGTSSPPSQQLLIAGADSNATPLVTAAGFDSNAVHERVNLEYGRIIDGFANSKAGDLHPHQLRFMVRDYSGLVGVAGDANCTKTNVYASAILGFLKASKCFIATATFRDPNHPAVMMLREFRDQFLERFTFGHSFVRFYYRHSPPLAEWLMEHSLFRPVVFLALTPVLVFAWALLHPMASLFLGLGIGTWIWVIHRSRRQSRSV